MTAPARPAISLIGAPTDVGASDRGASMGPEAMRVAGLQAALEARGLSVADLGKSVGGSIGGSVGRALVRGALGGLLRR